MTEKGPPVDAKDTHKAVATRVLHRSLAPLFEAHPIQAALLAASVAAASFANTRIWVEFSKVNSASQTALNKRDVGVYWQNRRAMLVVLVRLALASSLEEFCVAKLSLLWRSALTHSILKKYLPPPSPDTGLQEFPFYRMKLDPSATPNPDQRIADDVADAVYESVDLASSLISNTVSFASWSWVLWRISPRAFQGLLLYAFFGTLVSVCGFSKGLIRAQHRVRSSEAHFRLAMVRVDECAESVAFYRAADAERNRLMSAFAMIVRDRHHRLYWRLGQGSFQRTYSFITMVLPSMMMAPAYFRGDVELGAISQIFSAFNSVKQVLMFVANNFGPLADLQAKAQRLEDLHQSISRASAPLPSRMVTESQIAHGNKSGDCSSAQAIKLDELSADETSVLLRVQGLRLWVQTRSQTGVRVRWLSTIAGMKEGSTFEVGPGMALLLKGPSGVGKSALLRAIAGLWKEGVGSIQRARCVLFLPQTPYIPAGSEDAHSSLREQLLFPLLDGSISYGAFPSAEKLCNILHVVGLGSLLEEPAGLEHQADWALTLSGGERQRLAFARLLVQLAHLAGPDGVGCLVLIDEATSACDEELEGALYETLLQHLKKGALVSVGHRSSLSRFHSVVFELSSHTEVQEEQKAGA